MSDGEDEFAGLPEDEEEFDEEELEEEGSEEELEEEKAGKGKKGSKSSKSSKGSKAKASSNKRKKSQFIEEEADEVGTAGHSQTLQPQACIQQSGGSSSVLASGRLVPCGVLGTEQRHAACIRSCCMSL